jgi:hypothetical protein
MILVVLKDSMERYPKISTLFRRTENHADLGVGRRLRNAAHF